MWELDGVRFLKYPQVVIAARPGGTTRDIVVGEQGHCPGRLPLGGPALVHWPVATLTLFHGGDGPVFLAFEHSPPCTNVRGLFSSEGAKSETGSWAARGRDRD